MSDESDKLNAYVRDELPRIVNLVRESGVRELELQSEGARLLIRRAPADQSRVAVSGDSVETTIAATVTTGGPAIRTVSAPIVGTFYHSEQPGRAPLVEEGSRVERGSLIGVIEALQVLTEVESDVEGIVHRIVAPDTKPVQFGQPLVEVLVDG